MMKNLRKALVLSLLLPLVFACRKKKDKNISPFGDGKPVCALLALTSETSETIRAFEYVSDNLIRIYSLEESKTIMSFKYDEKNVITNMKVETENDLEKLNVDYIYDADGRVSQTTTSIAGIPIVTNTFVMSNGKITSVLTKFSAFGSEINAITRIIFKDDNVNAVYTSIDGEPEKLAFRGEAYDDQPQFHPAAYKTAALGFVGIANNFFSFFGKNNLVSGMIYDENGNVDQKTDISYTYAKNGLPTSSQTMTERNGETSIQNVKYEFNCD
ncbi:MAG: hypothetical protein ACI9DJ_001193 [Algoriphagus sp.]|jgi:hypothetical protein